MLELEVSHLEQYLLSLYRKAYDQQISSSSPPNKDEELKSTSSTPRGRRRLDFSKSSYTSTREYVAPEAETRSSSKLKIEANGPGEDKFVIQRSNSSVSQSLGLASKTSLPAEDLGKALRSCYSQPLSMMEVSNLHSWISNYFKMTYLDNVCNIYMFFLGKIEFRVVTVLI